MRLNTKTMLLLGGAAVGLYWLSTMAAPATAAPAQLPNGRRQRGQQALPSPGSYGGGDYGEPSYQYGPSGMGAYPGGY